MTKYCNNNWIFLMLMFPMSTKTDHYKRFYLEYLHVYYYSNNIPYKCRKWWIWIRQTAYIYSQIQMYWTSYYIILYEKVLIGTNEKSTSQSRWHSRVCLKLKIAVLIKIMRIKYWIEIHLGNVAEKSNLINFMNS